MYDEEDLLLVSALQHLAFCERQWGLIYLECAWAENPLTVEGRHLHEQADEPHTEVRGDLRIAHGLRLRCLRLGLTGRADVVEFHRLPDQEEDHVSRNGAPFGIRLQDVPGLWRPVPVEYKHGRPKPDRCDEVQLCGQAFCLEEMLEVSIPAGAIFYGTPRRRYDVTFDEELRRETEALAARLHELTRQRRTPPPKYEKKCRSCSLLSLCLPKATSRGRSVKEFLSSAIGEAAE
jgi:CRISPR-associated exonuclease Cas4